MTSVAIWCILTHPDSELVRVSENSSEYWQTLLTGMILDAAHSRSTFHELVGITSGWDAQPLRLCQRTRVDPSDTVMQSRTDKLESGARLGGEVPTYLSMSFCEDKQFTFPVTRDG